MEVVVIKQMATMVFKNPDSIDGSNLSIKNPVKSELNLFVNSNEKMNYEIEIFDFAGVSVKRATLKNANIESLNTINVQDLKKEIYIWNIGNEVKIIRKKIIKKNKL